MLLLALQVAVVPVMTLTKASGKAQMLDMQRGHYYAVKCNIDSPLHKTVDGWFYSRERAALHRCNATGRQRE